MFYNQTKIMKNVNCKCLYIVVNFLLFEYSTAFVFYSVIETLLVDYQSLDGIISNITRCINIEINMIINVKSILTNEIVLCFGFASSCHIIRSHEL